MPSATRAHDRQILQQMIPYGLLPHVMSHLSGRDIHRLMAVDRNTRQAASDNMHIVHTTRPFNVDGLMDYPLGGLALGGVFQELDDTSKTVLTSLLTHVVPGNTRRFSTDDVAKNVYKFLKRKGYNRLANHVIRLLSASQKNPDHPYRAYAELPLNVFTRPPRRATVMTRRPDLPPVVRHRRGRTVSRSRYQHRVNPQLSSRNHQIHRIFKKANKKLFQFIRSLPPGVAVLAMNSIMGMQADVYDFWDHLSQIPFQASRLRQLPSTVRQKLGMLIEGDIPDIDVTHQFYNQVVGIQNRLDDDEELDIEGHLEQ